MNILFQSDYHDFKGDVSLQKSMSIGLLRKNPGSTVDYFVKRRKIYDSVIVFNSVKESISVKTYKGNVFAIMQEPGENILYNPFMFKNLEQFDTVLSPIIESKNTIQSHGYLPWSFSFSYDQLINLSCPSKSKLISCIVSSKKAFKGHKDRCNFIDNLTDSKEVNIDLFGRGRNFIEKKEDGLLDYKYSIAIENSSKDFYFTEKITDCFLCYTIPFYYGCKNIDAFFPKESYVQIDINNPQKALKQIKEELESDNFKNRLPYLEEARELVLNKYNTVNLLTHLKPQIKQNISNNKIKKYNIKSLVHKKKNFISIIKNLIKSLYLKSFKIIMFFIGRGKK
ncbi:glycosyltransferase family 10 [Candidatus Haliotispira prima]|uniref:Glycosyltransferase family 10 n=1 Tax=Candidatus Haliotispira prima TaxID=3034016 RepID=A0ABY8MJP6_9SPIO|nr:glycosyltransferase family 10 [Candidatus Haliotispira prima]